MGFLESEKGRAAPTATLPAPEVSLLEETREGGTRTLRVSSPRRAPLVSIYIESDGELLRAEVNGRAAPTAHRQRKPWGVRYHAFQGEGRSRSCASGRRGRSSCASTT